MLPQFSLRVILILVTAAALLSAVAARMAQGDTWAVGVIAAFAWAAFALVIHALFYLAALAMSGFDEQTPRKNKPGKPTPAGVEDAPVE